MVPRADTAGREVTEPPMLFHGPYVPSVLRWLTSTSPARPRATTSCVPLARDTADGEPTIAPPSERMPPSVPSRNRRRSPSPAGPREKTCAVPALVDRAVSGLAATVMREQPVEASEPAPTFTPTTQTWWVPAGTRTGMS